jgi:hypothetical protein
VDVVVHVLVDVVVVVDGFCFIASKTNSGYFRRQKPIVGHAILLEYGNDLNHGLLGKRKE